MDEPPGGEAQAGSSGAEPTEPTSADAACESSAAGPTEPSAAVDAPAGDASAAVDAPTEPSAADAPAEPSAADAPAKPSAADAPAELSAADVPAEPSAVDAPAEPLAEEPNKRPHLRLSDVEDDDGLPRREWRAPENAAKSVRTLPPIAGVSGLRLSEVKKDLREIEQTMATEVSAAAAPCTSPPNE